MEEGWWRFPWLYGWDCDSACVWDLSYIAEALAGSGVAITRIAHGVPLGGELEYVGGATIAHALTGRRPLP